MCRETDDAAVSSNTTAQTHNSSRARRDSSDRAETMISAYEGKASDDQILQTRLLAKESVVIGPSINKMASKVSHIVCDAHETEDEAWAE